MKYNIQVDIHVIYATYTLFLTHFDLTEFH